MKTVNQFYKELFGEKVYKISLDAGCTCPNRDGTIGTGGCIFCSQTGSGDFTASRHLSITEQVEQAKKLVDSKFSRKDKLHLSLSPLSENSSPHKYIAYFQNFTNTYGNPEQLAAKWKEALSCPGIVGLAIGTRPDCLSPEILAILKELAEKTFLQVELGFQTANENAADFFHRGFKNQVYDQAVAKLHEASSKIHVVTHIIFGLPVPVENHLSLSPMEFNLSLSPLSETPSLRLETLEEQLNSLQHAIDSGTNGIKITVLYVLQNTQLQKYYEAGAFKTLEMNEYFNYVEEALKIIPEHIIIHRLTGDPPKKLLISPEWTANKKIVLNRINQLIK